jgi:hypothetical protein
LHPNAAQNPTQRVCGALRPLRSLVSTAGRDRTQSRNALPALPALPNAAVQCLALPALPCLLCPAGLLWSAPGLPTLLSLPCPAERCCAMPCTARPAVQCLALPCNAFPARPAFPAGCAPGQCPPWAALWAAPLLDWAAAGEGAHQGGFFSGGGRAGRLSFVLSLSTGLFPYSVGTPCEGSGEPWCEETCEPRLRTKKRREVVVPTPQHRRDGITFVPRLPDQSPTP